MIKVSVLVLLVLGACSPGHIAANKGAKEWVWVGCHIVTINPSPSGEYAIGPTGDLDIGDKLYYKQKRKNGTVGPVTTAIPCGPRREYMSSSFIRIF